MNKSANMSGLEKMAVELGIMVDPTKLFDARQVYDEVPELDERNSSDSLRKQLSRTGWGLPAAGAAFTGITGAGIGTIIANGKDGNDLFNRGTAIGGGLGALIGLLAGRGVADIAKSHMYSSAVNNHLAAPPAEAAKLYGTKGKTWDERYEDALRKQRGF